jgi:hypothetical protein
MSKEGPCRCVEIVATACARAKLMRHEKPQDVVRNDKTRSPRGTGQRPEVVESFAAPMKPRDARRERPASLRRCLAGSLRIITARINAPASHRSAQWAIREVANGRMAIDSREAGRIGFILGAFERAGTPDDCHSRALGPCVTQTKVEIEGKAQQNVVDRLTGGSRNPEDQRGHRGHSRIVSDRNSARLGWRVGPTCLRSFGLEMGA